MDIAGYVSRKNLQSYRIGYDRHLHAIADPSHQHNRGRLEVHAGTEKEMPEWMIIEKPEPMVKYLNRLGISNDEISKIPNLPNCMKSYLGIDYDEVIEEGMLSEMMEKNALLGLLSGGVKSGDGQQDEEDRSLSIELSDELIPKKRK